MFGKFTSIKYLFGSIGLAIIASFILPLPVYQANLWIEPSSGNLIQNCSYQMAIKMDTNDKETTSVDAKLFLSGFDFLNVIDGAMDAITVLSGTASQGIHSGEEYLYINNYQLGSPLSGHNITLAHIQIQTHTGLQTLTGSLQFYFLGSGVNSDDSTISQGAHGTLNNYTSYKDILYQTIGGVFSIFSGNSCEEPPLVISGFYYQTTFTDSGFQYQSLDTKLLAGPQISHTSGREIRTNTAVNLIITGDKNLHIVENSLSGLPVVLPDNNPDTIDKTLLITGNTGPHILQYEYSGVIGSGYDYTVSGSHITGTFYIDVFWIDKELPTITGLIHYNPGYINVLLSGNLGGANRTTKDDEYKILAFSGTSPAPTSYLSGNISGNNLFALTHSIDFSGARSGDIVYMDRAGNTGSIFLELKNKNQYLFKAHPASRLITSSTPNPNLASIYSIVVYSQTGLVITTGTVETNHYGTGIFETYENLSGIYNVSIRGLAHLTSLLSGVNIDSSHQFIDATSGSLTRFNGPIKDDILNYSFSYQQIGGGAFSNNLSIYSWYNNFPVWDAYQLLTSTPNGIQVSSGVEWTGLSSSIGTSGSLYYQNLIKDTSDPHFEINPSYQFYSGTENITQSGFFTVTSGVQVVSVEIPGELVVDGEINGVDSSVIIQYIRDHGALNNNTTFGLVPEDLNANGQVDAADITVHGYNLYRTTY